MSAFVFDTEAQYLTAKASGVIYTALQTSGVVSRSTVSFCKDSGKTYTDAVNVIVEREKGGDIGDCLIRNKNTGIFAWLKSCAAYSATSKGGLYMHEGDLNTAGYYRIGFVIENKGGKCLLLSIADQSSGSAWSDNTTTIVPNIFTDSSIRRHNGGNNAFYDTWIASGSMDRAEEQYGTGVYQYTWPLPRAQWNACMEKVYANQSGSGTFTDGLWTTTATTNGTGMATASITYKCTEGSVTINPKDYGYDFNRWYERKVILQYPTKAGCMRDRNGRANTKALLAWAAGGAGTCPAATVCNNYAPSNSGDKFAAGKWWLPSVAELWLALKHYFALKKKGCSITLTWYWSSTQYSASNAWLVHFYYARVSYLSKSYSGYVRACSAFDIFKD